MALSDTAIRKAKGRERPYRLSDGRGLYLLVQPDGARWWRFDFSMNGKRRTMGLGVYPDVELADARKERDRFRKFIARGIDPVKARRTGAGETEASFKAFRCRSRLQPSFGGDWKSCRSGSRCSSVGEPGVAQSAKIQCSMVSTGWVTIRA
jgi:hypothetical protein